MNKKLIRNKKNAVVITLVVSMIVGTVINAGSWYQLLAKGEDNTIEQKDSRIENVSDKRVKVVTSSLDEFDSEYTGRRVELEDSYEVYDENYNIVNKVEEFKSESVINTIAQTGNLGLNTQKEIKVKKVSSKTNNTMDLSSTELKYLASLVFAEAGSEPYTGKVAVANVVINRCKSKKFPNTVKKVITQRGQFGPYSNGQLNKAMKKYSKGYFTKPGAKYKNYRNSLTAVKKAIGGYSTVGQRRYFNGKRHSRPRKNQKIIGNHRFW